MPHREQHVPFKAPNHRFAQLLGVVFLKEMKNLISEHEPYKPNLTFPFFIPLIFPTNNIFSHLNLELNISTFKVQRTKANNLLAIQINNTVRPRGPREPFLDTEGLRGPLWSGE